MGNIQAFHLLIKQGSGDPQIFSSFGAVIVETFQNIDNQFSLRIVPDLFNQAFSPFRVVKGMLAARIPKRNHVQHFFRQHFPADKVHGPFDHIIQFSDRCV